uniref:Plastid lipid-associated protein/fibrillin conserved domain-containing protein n=1 Tax=Tetraselmis sp. GSL018 TaxID=582737 RepID=A0A061QZ91_9CHLO
MRILASVNGGTVLSSLRKEHTEKILSPNFSQPQRKCRRHSVVLCVAPSKANADRAELKARLKRLAANTRRGKEAAPEVRSGVLEAVRELEALSPEPDPVGSRLLSGTWSLLYNGADRVDDEEWRRSSGEVEGPFLSFFKPIARGVVETRGDTQVFDVDNGRVENIATGGRSVRLAVEFTDFVLTVGSWSTEVSLNAVRPQGWVQTTYLDEDFRIGRGDKGSVFITARKLDED